MADTPQAPVPISEPATVRELAAIGILTGLLAAAETEDFTKINDDEWISRAIRLGDRLLARLGREIPQ